MDTKTFEELFTVLAEGTSAEIKEAKKCIEKRWKDNRVDFKKSAPLIFRYIATFDAVTSPVHKAAIISGMRMFYFVLANEHFPALKDFIIQNLQHPDGRVREASRHTAEWLHISLTLRNSPFVFPEGKGLSPKQKADQAIAEKQYIDFVTELETLMEKCAAESDEDAEYVADMKPSVEKSLQQVWARVTDSPVYREILERTRPIPTEVFFKRKEIEYTLMKLLATDDDIAEHHLEHIKQMVYEEDGVGSMYEIIEFVTNISHARMDTVVEVVNDVWNYFPHKELDGKSPWEAMAEYRHMKA